MASILCCTSGNQTVEAVVQPAWDNHFAAFGGQDVSKVLLDYCEESKICLLYTSPSPRDRQKSRMPSSA